jgi:uncharacterized protein (DUF58 family)
MRPNELQFLDPAIIASLGSLELKARTIVEGFLSGLHRSPYKGFSVEFAEYRQYMPGDDLSTIDWKVYARSDRFYVKKYEEETNLECRIALDVSASMGFRSGTLSKFDYSLYLAAALAYLMSRQRDAVGLLTFDERIVSLLPPSARPGHLRSLLVSLQRLRLGEKTNVSKPLHQLAEALSRRGLVVLISDLLDEPRQIVEGLKHFRFQGHEVAVFHVLDNHELTFPFERTSRFTDLETGDEIMAAPRTVRTAYLQQINALMELYRQELRLAGIDYTVLDSSQPLDFALMSYLATRGRLY